jgi:hypothetical protein
MFVDDLVTSHLDNDEVVFNIIALLSDEFGTHQLGLG